MLLVRIDDEIHERYLSKFKDLKVLFNFKFIYSLFTDWYL